MQTYRSTLRTLVTVVSAIFIPVHGDAKATEIVSAFQDDGIFEEVKTDGACELFLQVVSSCTSCSHVSRPKAAAQQRCQQEEEGDRCVLVSAASQLGSANQIRSSRHVVKYVATCLIMGAGNRDRPRSHYFDCLCIF